MRLDAPVFGNRFLVQPKASFAKERISPARSDGEAAHYDFRISIFEFRNQLCFINSPLCPVSELYSVSMNASAFIN